MTEAELQAIDQRITLAKTWWCGHIDPERHAAARGLPTDAADLFAEVRRLQAQLRAERDALALTMEYVESDGERGLRAW
jgi:hypothetical protein